MRPALFNAKFSLCFVMVSIIVAKFLYFLYFLVSISDLAVCSLLTLDFSALGDVVDLLPLLWISHEMWQIVITFPFRNILSMIIIDNVRQTEKKVSHTLFIFHCNLDFYYFRCILSLLKAKMSFHNPNCSIQMSHKLQKSSRTIQWNNVLAVSMQHCFELSL